MATFSLDQIREAAEAKYGSTDIELGDDVVRLLNPLRLSKDKRAKLTNLQAELENEESDQEQIMADAIVLVAENTAKGKALVKTIGGDLAVLAEIFELYGKSSQVGEA